MLELKPQHWLTKEELRIKNEQLQLAETENQQLREQLQTPGASLAPDYEAIRDRTLNQLRMGRQSPTGKAIQAFIKELKASIAPE